MILLFGLVGKSLLFGFWGGGEGGSSVLKNFANKEINGDLSIVISDMKVDV
jgi:hypothetical protein